MRWVCIWLILFINSAFAQGGMSPGPGTPATNVLPTKTLTLIAASNTEGTSTSYTYNGAGIGTAGSDRVVIIGTSIRYIGTAACTLSATINAVSATAIVQGKDSVTNTTAIALFGLLVTTGTTANIVINSTCSAVRNAIVIYSLTGTGGLVTTNDNGAVVVNSNPISKTLNTVANGCAIGFAVDGSTGNLTYSWTNLTLDTQAAFGVGGNTYSSASKNNTSSGTLAISATYSSTPVEGALVAASW